jgi:hypothetical protein
MTLLAPLYIAGALAIGLPILFHLIRRTPQGRQPFSSLMFLQPSPPRLTRRSRLSNLWLLLLRALALALLAFAFARPFLPGSGDLSVTEARGRRIAVVVDTSASMRRADLWKQATDHAEQALKDAGPADELGLFFFDSRVRPALTFAEWNELDAPRRAAMFRARLAEASPTWAPTRIGEALAAVSDLMSDNEGTKKLAAAAPPTADKIARQIVLISDLQQGGHVETLQSRPWPEDVLLDVKTVAPKQPTANASVQLVRQTPAAEEPDKTTAAAAATGPRLRVRVGNEPDSTKEQFTLAWANERGPIAGLAPVTAYVPPGRSHVVRVPLPPAERGADRLVLAGDDTDFDNTLYVVPPRQDAVRVLFVGDDAPDDVKGLLYYLQSAWGETPQRKIDLVARKTAEPITGTDLLGARLAVVTVALPDDRADLLRRFADAGGDVLWVMRDAAAGSSVAKLLAADKIEADEAPPRDYALVNRVETRHPLFAPFADARFADFTKVRFWKHRRLKLPEKTDAKTDARVLAWFDNGDPFLIEQTIGRGRALIATSGWHPADSQFALSTKFVPLVDGLIRRKDGAAADAQYAVGDPIALPAQPGSTDPRSLTTPDGKKIVLPATATTFDAADRPGLYRLASAGAAAAPEPPIAVNLASDESRTAPVDVAELEKWGARLGAKPTSDELVARERRLKTAELENRQKLWRWFIVGVLGLLAAETALAGHLARRGQQQLPQPQSTQQQATT